MFEYRYPRFESKRLLRPEMLDLLRDYPDRFSKLLWDGYAQGIVSGCAVSWAGGVLTVGRGILYKNKKFYFMDEPFDLPCKPLDKVRYLKVRMLPEEERAGEIYGQGKIILEEEKPDDGYELELCRFRLQEGSRLRVRHEGFEDFSTEYDTVDYTWAPWAGREYSVLNPLMMRTFAREILRKDTGDFRDAAFAAAALSCGGKMDAEAVREYIRVKSGKTSLRGVRSLYEGLLSILKDGRYEAHSSKGSEQVLLI